MKKEKFETKYALFSVVNKLRHMVDTTDTPERYRKECAVEIANLLEKLYPTETLHSTYVASNVVEANTRGLYYAVEFWRDQLYLLEMRSMTNTETLQVEFTGVRLEGTDARGEVIERAFIRNSEESLEETLQRVSRALYTGRKYNIALEYACRKTNGGKDMVYSAARYLTMVFDENKRRFLCLESAELPYRDANKYDTCEEIYKEKDAFTFYTLSEDNLRDLIGDARGDADNGTLTGIIVRYSNGKEVTVYNSARDRETGIDYDSVIDTAIGWISDTILDLYFDTDQMISARVEYDEALMQYTAHFC